MSKKDNRSLSEKKLQQEKKRTRQAILGAVALVAVIAVIIGAVVLFRYVDVGLHSSTAASSANRTMDKAMMTYYFNEYLSDYVNERLYYIEAGYLNLSLKTGLKDQTYDGTNTWYSYFAGKARDSARRDMLLCELAAEEGISLTAQEQQVLADKAAAVKPSDYGNGLETEDVLRCLEQQALADKYLSQTEANLYGEPADWAAYYDAHTADYESVDYLYAEIVPIIDSEEEQKAYDALLEKALDSKDPQVFADTVKKIFINHADMSETDAQSKADGLEQLNETMMEDNPLHRWLFYTAQRKAEEESSADFDETTEMDVTALYDTYIDETTSSCKLYMITRLAGKNTASTVNYRNILIPSGEGAESTARDLLSQWKEGDATSESFGQLAETYSQDSLSKESGGIYENVFRGRMGGAVDRWLFDEDRKPGDTTLLETSEGFQVLYYEGEGVERWQVSVRNDIRTERYEELLADAEKTFSYKLNDSVLDSIRYKITYR